MRGVLAAGSAIAVLATVAVTAARAQTEQPQPCNEPSVTDPAGDQAPPFADAASAPADNTDVTAVFFRYENGALTANIQVSDLTKEVYTGTAATEWVVFYSTPTADLVAGALLPAAGEPSYYSGSVYFDAEPLPPATTGQFHEGKGGVVEIAIPAGQVAPGTTLSGISAAVRMNMTATSRDGYSYIADVAPDEGAGSFVVTTCAESAQTATPGPSPTAVATATRTATPTRTPSAISTATPTATPTQEGTASATPTPFMAPSGRPVVTVATPVPTAAPGSQSTDSPGTRVPPRLPCEVAAVTRLRRAGARSSFAIQVSAREPIQNLIVRLRRHDGATLAIGRIRSITGVRTMKLIPRGALPAGRYSLDATGVVSGQTRTMHQTVTLIGRRR